MSDNELAERFQQHGDNASFAELFKRYRKSIFAACLATVHDPAAAEDLTQETFMRAFCKIDKYEADAFGAWLRTIAIRLSLNHLRSKVSRFVPLEGVEDGLQSRETAGWKRHDEIEQAMEVLSPAQRVCLTLFLVHGYTFDEISRLTGHPAGRVRAHIQNGKLKLVRQRGKQ